MGPLKEPSSHIAKGKAWYRTIEVPFKVRIWGLGPHNPKSLQKKPNNPEPPKTLKTPKTLKPPPPKKKKKKLNPKQYTIPVRLYRKPERTEAPGGLHWSVEGQRAWGRGVVVTTYSVRFLFFFWGGRGVRVQGFQVFFICVFCCSGFGVYGV